jgi:hypothetical protein
MMGHPNPPVLSMSSSSQYLLVGFLLIYAITTVVGWFLVNGYMTRYAHSRNPWILSSSRGWNNLGPMNVCGGTQWIFLLTSTNSSLPPPFGSGGICRFVRSLEAIHPVEILEHERERERKVVCCLVTTHHHCDWCIPPCIRRYIVVTLSLVIVVVVTFPTRTHTPGSTFWSTPPNSFAG